MRILEIVSGDRVNGAIKHCHDLTLRLRDRGHEMCVACLPDTWIAETLAADGIDTIPSDLHRWPGDELRRISAEIQRRNIDVVHTHMSRAHFFGVLLRWYAGVPSVATAHCRNFQLHWMMNDHVIAVSDATRDYHIRRNFVRRDRIETVHNFVDLSKPQQATTEAKQRLLDELNIGHQNIGRQTKLITFVGAIEKRKGLVHLADAMDETFEQQPDAHLLLVGAPDHSDYHHDVRLRCEALKHANRIHFLGGRNDVKDILGVSDLFVLPSLEESLPMTILEAMSAGVPVIATDVGGVAECVVDGKTGFLVPPADSAALSQRMTQLLANPELARRLGDCGQRVVDQKFSPNQQMAKIEQVFERAAGLPSQRVRAAA